MQRDIIDRSQHDRIVALLEPPAPVRRDDPLAAEILAAHARLGDVLTPTGMGADDKRAITYLARRAYLQDAALSENLEDAFLACWEVLDVAHLERLHEARSKD